MIHIGLFEGIGGFSLAAHWAGWETLATCEINPFGQKVLKHYWPDAYHHGDIKTLTYDAINTELSKRFGGGGWRNQPVIITGGFPCQPYSLAGKRLGKEDDRHLWPEMLRVIREVSPEWVVGENVLGLINWSGGLVFHEVQADLEAAGYEVQPYVLPACAVGAPHRRERIWFVAYSNKRTAGPSRTSERTFGERGNNNDEPKEWREQTEQRFRHGHVFRNDTHTDIKGLQRSEKPGSIEESRKERNKLPTRFFKPTWNEFPTQSPVRSRYDGFSRQLVRYITKDLHNAISNTSEENRIQNLSEVWQRVQQKEIWKQIRGFYSLESKEILLQTMQLYSSRNIRQDKLSPFSENVSERILSTLRKYGEFRRSPQGQKLQEQQPKQFGNIMSYLPHEIPLAARAFESAMAKFESWHRAESIKALGNAIVPQVAYQIFKAINQYNFHE